MIFIEFKCRCGNEYSTPRRNIGRVTFSHLCPKCGEYDPISEKEVNH